jgi:hypothetical protein
MGMKRQMDGESVVVRITSEDHKRRGEVERGEVERGEVERGSEQVYEVKDISTVFLF